MQTSVVSKQFDLGESLTKYATETLTKTVTKYFDRAISADAVFTKEGDFTKVDISVHAAANLMIQAHDSSPDVYKAFDEAINKLAIQLAKQKDKITDYNNEINDSFKS